MKTKFFLLFLATASLYFSSCGTKESIQRDLSIQLSPVAFTIAVSDTTQKEKKFAELSSPVNLADSISKNTSGQFALANINSAILSSFKIDLVNADTTKNNTNNFSAYDFIRIQLKVPGTNPISLAMINNNSTAAASSLNIPVVTGATDFQQYLKSGTLTYIISGTVRNATTKIITAKATATYKISSSR
ncbi:hypothetical protein [Pedobacter nutrimenti]|jgi:hypothetical protein|uniref:Uncharacterized protein n=1 Tax=Pedobacter nutrimenti TaxID=1241337 RepID=A0A318ULC5_9SPHI|nr:hypothetical protein [Pedobacter nutrimenti]PYF76883.1 hypothetical protein B0O44_101358 [Pedobacter nutrimenti]